MATADEETAHNTATSLYELVRESGPETSVLAKATHPVITVYTRSGLARISSPSSGPAPSKPLVDNIQPATTRIDSIALGTNSDVPLIRYNYDCHSRNNTVPARKCKRTCPNIRLEHLCTQYAENDRDLPGTRTMLMERLYPAKYGWTNPEDVEALIGLLRYESVYNSRYDLCVALRKQLGEIKQAGLLQKPYASIYCLIGVIIGTLARQGKVSFRKDRDPAITARGPEPEAASCSTCLPLSPAATSAFDNGQSGTHGEQSHKSQTSFIPHTTFVQQTPAARLPEQISYCNGSTYPRSQWPVPFAPVSDNEVPPVRINDLQTKNAVPCSVDAQVTRLNSVPDQLSPHDSPPKRAEVDLHRQAHRQSLVDWITSRQVCRERQMEESLQPEVTSVSGVFCWPDTRPPPPQSLDEQERPLPPGTTSVEELVFHHDTGPLIVVTLAPPPEPVPSETRSKRDFFEEEVRTAAPLCKLPLRPEVTFTPEVKSKWDVWRDEAPLALPSCRLAIPSIQEGSTASASSYEVHGRAQTAGVLPVRPKTTPRKQPEARVTLPRNLVTKKQKPLKKLAGPLSPAALSSTPVKLGDFMWKPKSRQEKGLKIRPNTPQGELASAKSMGNTGGHAPADVESGHQDEEEMGSSVAEASGGTAL